MKSIGFTRKIDPLGRLVIPMELRRTMDIDIGDPLEIFVDDDLVILRKYSPHACIVTGDILRENIEYPGGIILSPKGAEILLGDIQALRKSDLLHN